MNLIPVLGISPGGGRGNPFQYSCLENSMDRGVHGVTKSRTRLKQLSTTQVDNAKWNDALGK